MRGLSMVWDHGPVEGTKTSTLIWPPPSPPDRIIPGMQGLLFCAGRGSKKLQILVEFLRNWMLLHVLEVNLELFHIIRHQFLRIQTMRTESLTKYIRVNNKWLKLWSIVLLDFLVYEKMVPEGFILFLKIFTPAGMVIIIREPGHVIPEAGSTDTSNGQEKQECHPCIIFLLLCSFLSEDLSSMYFQN